MKRFFSELQRRKVIKALVVYVGVIWLLLQVVSVLSGMLGLSKLVGTATFIALMCALPIVMYFSWHFDLSLNGITRTPPLPEQSATGDDENAPIKPLGAWSWIGLFAVVLISGAIGVQTYNTFEASVLEAEQAANQAIEKSDSIAVLPFKDDSSAQDQSYLATGLAEEITNQLGRTDLFKVSASRSSQVLVEKGLIPSEIGQRLGVQTLLTGSISSTNDRVSIRVELQDTASARVLWTETFVREFSNIFDLESEISRAVVNLLQDKFVEAGDLSKLSSTSDVDAYVLYLKGREAYRKQTAEAMQEARAYFEEAIAVDPEYAKAYVALADALASLSEGVDGFGVLAVDIAADLAEQNLEKALAREPDIPEIFAVKGVVLMLRDEYESALEAYDKAIALNPNLAIAYMWKSLALTTLQQYEEAIAAQRQSQKLDPLFLTSSYNLGVLLIWQAQYGEAEALFDQLRIDFPESAFSYIGAADLYYSQANFVESIRQWKKAVKLSPSNLEFERKMFDAMIMLGLTDIIKASTDDPGFDSTILIFEKKYSELFEKMDFEIAANPDDYWVAFEAGWYHSMFGDTNIAAELITNKEELISDLDKFYMPYCSPAIELAWAYQVKGNMDKSKMLIDECESLLNAQKENSITYSETNYLEARIFALRGESTKAASALETAIDKGWREWWTSYDPLLNAVNNEPKINTLIRFIEDDLAKQKEEAKRLFEDVN
ncbi:tetratricopeptide repeat protein [Glaciecola petra]|uniref:Tetratricopeptide repeat protein n=1 Tax=Glaciecola petra TaxID=3075602 RepID=A0ABU2ZUU8_9ALTE|nr:tetratricopeptide repeat protein [Aestuariibacter sp. P117]MDT0596417.1 tetratricopeptide repeat protein [Aestuariibacter sp. P117]